MPERYYRELLRYFARKAGDGDTAADVVQEAYARVIALQHKGTDVLQPRALLYRVGRNLLSRQRLREATERRVLEALAIVSPDAAPSTEHRVGARQQLGRLLALLEAMPAKRREAFILVRIHGLSYADSSRHMGVSELAIERHLARALLDFAGYTRP